jgi:hypothetical protein
MGFEKLAISRVCFVVLNVFSLIVINIVFKFIFMLINELFVVF